MGKKITRHPPKPKPEPNDADRERAMTHLCAMCPGGGDHLGTPAGARACFECTAAELAAVREETEVKTCLLPIKDIIKIKMENITEEGASKWLDNIHKFIDEEDPLDPAPCGKEGHLMVHWVEEKAGMEDLKGSFRLRHFEGDPPNTIAAIKEVCTLCQQQEAEIKQAIGKMSLKEIIKIKHENNTPKEAAEQLANIKRNLAEGEETDRQEFEQKIKPLVEALEQFPQPGEGEKWEDYGLRVKWWLETKARAALKAWEGK